MWDALFINPNLQSLKQEKLWDCDLDLILRNVSAFCIKFRESSGKLSEKLLACFDAVFNENASNNSSDRGWLLPMPLMLSAMVRDLPWEPRWSPHSWPHRGDTPDWVLMSRNCNVATWVSKILAKDFPELIIWNCWFGWSLLLWWYFQVPVEGVTPLQALRLCPLSSFIIHGAPCSPITNVHQNSCSYWVNVRKVCSVPTYGFKVL